MAETTAQQLRRFLLGVVVVTFLGSFLELGLLEHTGDQLQWIPFIASGFGLLAVGWLWFSPSELSVKVLRVVMLLVALTSFWGVYLHFEGNLAFAREIHPSYSLSETLWAAVKGSNPLLSPGILLLAGVLGMAATLNHPVLFDDQ